MHTKHYSTLIYNVWRYFKASSLKYPSKLKALKENSTKIPIIDKAHTHPPNTHEVKVYKCLARMKYKTATTSTNLIEIYCEELGSLNNETRAKMQLETITKRTFRNQRSKNNLKEPRHLDDCIIKGNWALTNDGLILLLKDSIEDRFEDKVINVIIFSTDEGLKHLTEAETWIFDEDVIPVCVVSVLQVNNMANFTQSKSRFAPLV
ncbi:uncharacterized protein LOC112600645 [Melanaphis sacchari]|uniref:uncharacterized protein LOC112600645 n=1 Tax=Melanaphis sacchari TaxID=742174 RepID=UPI000DC13CCD|nr:uncharacterized protein LOC112600645 [Melanaphis sacchari]